MSEAVLAAVIAAAVSGVAAVLSYVATQRKLAAERRNLNSAQRRRLTEKLYDLRLDCYPSAFEITDRLRGEYLFSDGLEADGGISRQEVTEVRSRLLKWHATKAGFVLSNSSLRAYYQLRDELADSSREPHSRNKVRRIWRAKNQFRGALKADLGLLYEEEREDSFRNQG